MLKPNPFFGCSQKEPISNLKLIGVALTDKKATKKGLIYYLKISQPPLFALRANLLIRSEVSGS